MAWSSDKLKEYRSRIAGFTPPSERNRPEAYEHFARIRNSSEYRMRLREVEHEGYNTQSFCQDVPQVQAAVLPVEIPAPTDGFQKLKSELKYIENKVNHHIDDKKPVVDRVRQAHGNRGLDV